MPVAATIPNITSPAPPSSPVGSDSTNAARRQQTQQHQNDAARHADEARAHASLATRPTFCEKLVVRERVEDAANQRAQTIGAQPGGERLLVDLCGNGHFAPAPGTCRWIQSSPRSSPASWSGSDRVSGRGDLKWQHHVEERRLDDLVEIHLAGDSGDHAADDVPINTAILRQSPWRSVRSAGSTPAPAPRSPRPQALHTSGWARWRQRHAFGSAGSAEPGAEAAAVTHRPAIWRDRVDHRRRGWADRIAENPVDADSHQANADHGDDRSRHDRWKKRSMRL